MGPHSRKLPDGKAKPGPRARILPEPLVRGGVIVGVVGAVDLDAMHAREDVGRHGQAAGERAPRLGGSIAVPEPLTELCIRRADRQAERQNRDDGLRDGPDHGKRLDAVAHDLPDVVAKRRGEIAGEVPREGRHGVSPGAGEASREPDGSPKALIEGAEQRPRRAGEVGHRRRRRDQRDRAEDVGGRARRGRGSRARRGRGRGHRGHASCSSEVAVRNGARRANCAAPPATRSAPRRSSRPRRSDAGPG